jgi:hypothetical protein
MKLHFRTAIRVSVASPVVQGRDLRKALKRGSLHSVNDSSASAATRSSHSLEKYQSVSRGKLSMAMLAALGIPFPNTCVLHNVDGKRAKAKAFALIKNWRSQSAAEERQSGVDVPYDERQTFLEDIKERMDDWASKERTDFEAAAKIKSDSEKKGKDLREASMSCLKRRKDPEAEGSESKNEKCLSAPRKRRVTNAFEESFESLKDSVKSSIEDQQSIQEREID